MLVLSRKLGDKILIGEGDAKVCITILRHGEGNRISIGIDVPRGVRVLREEVARRDREQGQQGDAAA